MPGALETWIDLPDRVVRAGVLTRPFEFASPFGAEPFALLLVVVDPSVTTIERDALCHQIARSGCRYVLCMGHQCSDWDTAVDVAHIATDPDFMPPESTHIMTSVHHGEPLADVIDFMLHATSFDDLWMRRFLIAFIGDDKVVRRECEAIVRRSTDRSSSGADPAAE